MSGVYTTVMFPFPVKASELPHEAIRPRGEYSVSQLYLLETVLVLEPDRLVCVKALYDDLSDTVFSVIPVHDGEAVNIPAEVKHVIFLHTVEFQWGPTDYLESYRKVRGEGHIDVTMQTNDILQVFSLCIGLSFLFGTKFDMHCTGDAAVYQVVMDKSSTRRNEHFQKILDNVSALLDSYSAFKHVSVYLDSLGYRYTPNTSVSNGADEDFDL